MATPSSGAPQHQGLPSISSLTNGLSSTHSQRSPDSQSLADSTRDSGTWPQPPSQSKHNSANSGLQVHTLLNPDDSPSRNSVPTTPSSGRGPLASLSGNAQLPSINQGFQDTAGNRDSQASMQSQNSHASIDSRRSSVDSRMHQTFGSLYINGPQSPYESQNTSQVSLAAGLRRPNGQPMSPLGGRANVRAAPRIAPPIVPVGRVPGGPDPTAAKPTQGFAWAFPDQAIPEERGDSDSDGESSHHGVSRTNSFAASSIRSSIFSNDSQLPSGQRRFDSDDQATTHHHSMQHRTIQNLQSEGQGAAGVGNYSRTPELRVSHKLAERKRRSEMKDLFEELNKAVPANGGAKASKWEILTKAIDYIRSTQTHERQLHAEVNRLSRDSEYAREAHKEIEMLRTEVQVMHQHLKRLDPNAPHVYGHLTSQIQQQAGPGSTQSNGASGISLPPLAAPSQGPSSYSSGGPPAAPMQGVEYGYGR